MKRKVFKFIMNIIEFFKSWGLEAEEDYTEIPVAVYHRMYEDAGKVGGLKFQLACNTFVDRVDNYCYLDVEGNDDLLERYNRL